MILYDTNVFIEYLNGNLLTLNSIKNIGFEKTLIPSITVIELIKGIKNKNQLKKLNLFINSFSILNFNEEVSLLSIELINNYHLSHNLHLADSIIAAS
ncbi:MAG: PIN domain-containing protein [Ignavibacteria bacterium]|nr:PIN domain-containing protein [Ignavibacteria bacterium]